MKRHACHSILCFFTVGVFLLLVSMPSDSPGFPAQKGIRPANSIAHSSAMGKAGKARLASSYGNLPLSFEPNQGQATEQVKFLSRGRGYALFLTGDEVVLALGGASEASPSKDTKAAKSSVPTKPDMLRMKLAGANQSPKVAGLDELPGKSNYLLGKNPKK